MKEQKKLLRLCAFLMTAVLCAGTLVCGVLHAGARTRLSSFGETTSSITLQWDKSAPIVVKEDGARLSVSPELLPFLQKTARWSGLFLPPPLGGLLWFAQNVQAFL
jgi:hypothetical protein